MISELADDFRRAHPGADAGLNAWRSVQRPVRSRHTREVVPPPVSHAGTVVSLMGHTHVQSAPPPERARSVTPIGSDQAVSLDRGPAPGEVRCSDCGAWRNAVLSIRCPRCGLAETR